MRFPLLIQSTIIQDKTNSITVDSILYYSTIRPFISKRLPMQMIFYCGHRKFIFVLTTSVGGKYISVLIRSNCRISQISFSFLVNML